MFKSRNKIGGVLRYGIPEFRLPKEILDRLKNKLVELGVKIRPNTLIGPVITIDDLVILDCTREFQKIKKILIHMWLKENKQIVHILKENKAIDDNSTVISHHFSHNGCVVYDRDKKLFETKG